MRIEVWKRCATLLLVCLVVACKGTITSPEPLINPENASYPFPPSVEVEARTLNDDHVWESIEGKAHMTLIDRSYRVKGPDESAPSPDTFLFKRIDDNLFIVQGSNGKEWAYGLVLHQDMYYLFTFNRADQNCTAISASERRTLNTTLRDDHCYVSSLQDLTALLLFFQQRFPYPTSAFVVRPSAKSFPPE